MRYFDHNATSPLCAAAREAWLAAVDQFPGNPSSPHRWGSRADRALEEARQGVAEAIGANAADVVWTSGATEAANAVFHSIAQDHDGEAWISAIEHPCVLAAADRWLPGRWSRIPVSPDGVVEINWVSDRLKTERPALVAVMAANNELGVLQPWEDILRRCRDREVPFFCDAAQWLGKLPAAGLGACHFLAGCAHKFGGPPGIGFLKVAGPMKALIVGGGQEDGRRAGTQNVPAAVGTAAALKERESALRAIPADQRAALRDGFETRIASAVYGLTRVGGRSPRLWNTSGLLMPPVDCRRRWVVRLDSLGFAVSTGSACSSGTEKPSHVLQALGLDATGERMLRISSGWETTAEDWDELGAALIRVAEEFGAVGRARTAVA